MEERYENRLKSLRVARGVSQSELAETVGLTRQAIYMIEASRYLPNATTALRIAKALQCKVEDLFALDEGPQKVEAELLEEASSGGRMKLWKVGGRTWALPLTTLEESADALATSTVRKAKSQRKVVLQSLQDPADIENQVAVAGCDPALSILADRLHRGREVTRVFVWPMGSTDALMNLARKKVHVAGTHLRGPSGEFNRPFLRKHLGRRKLTVVTLAFWEVGLVVARGNPKAIRSVSDLARRDVRIANREKGSGARQLLDRKLEEEGVSPRKVQGYRTVHSTHQEVARRVLEGAADAAVAPLVMARLFGLGFVTLADERYDLVAPAELVAAHRGVQRLLDALTSRSVRRELEALGGYDTQHSGEIVV
ncbi:MAG: substrate-binding domain-containing protein [Vicinamibacteria bacterium]